MVKIKHDLLSETFQEMFIVRKSQYDLRGLDIFIKKHFRTNTLKSCVSVKPGLHNDSFKGVL